MRTPTLNLPNNDVLISIHPISRGPYCGHDVLMLMDDLYGNVYVVRATLEGKHLNMSDKVSRESGMDLIKGMIGDQNHADCNAVTCNGRWECK